MKKLILIALLALTLEAPAQLLKLHGTQCPIEGKVAALVVESPQPITLTCTPGVPNWVEYLSTSPEPPSQALCRKRGDTLFVNYPVADTDAFITIILSEAPTFITLRQGSRLEVTNLGDETQLRQVIRVERDASLTVRCDYRPRYLHMDLFGSATFEREANIPKGTLNLMDSSSLYFNEEQFDLGPTVYVYNGHHRQGPRVRPALGNKLVHPWQFNRLHWYDRSVVKQTSSLMLSPSVGLETFTARGGLGRLSPLYPRSGFMLECNLTRRQQWVDQRITTYIGAGLVLETQHLAHQTIYANNTIEINDINPSPYLSNDWIGNLWLTLPMTLTYTPTSKFSYMVGLIPGLNLKSHYSGIGGEVWGGGTSGGDLRGNVVNAQRLDLLVALTYRGVRLPQVRFNLLPTFLEIPHDPVRIHTTTFMWTF